MSFVDLAAATMTRRNELEARISTFVTKCDRALENILKLKTEGQNMRHQLNCDPLELRERFLKCCQTLDDFSYLITDINIALENVGELKSSVEYTPVHDTSAKCLPLKPTTNIIDMLSEPAASTSSACPNFCPLEHKPRKRSKEEQTLIVFSSTSSSSESVPIRDVEKKEKDVECELPEAMGRACITEPVTVDPASPLPEQCDLPAQTVLQTDHVYPAMIMNIDGHSIWVITDNPKDIFQFMSEMTEFYKQNHTEWSLEEITRLSANKKLTYCAFYDEENDTYCRALFINLNKDIVEVFLVDTGEVRCGPAQEVLRPLAARYCDRPPAARCCHLAGIDMASCSGPEVSSDQEKFLSLYIGTQCTIWVDDNTSESLGVFVVLPDNTVLNDLLVQKGLAISCGERPSTSSVPPRPTSGPPEMVRSNSDLSNQEFEDPLEAVTGYSCRDEADICKHYRGGPEKTCFKGARCTKRHVLKHPDGWTLDRVEVVAKCPMLPLPAPGCWLRATVTCVAHYDRLFVQLIHDHPLEEESSLPAFGVVLPPASLDALVRDMNSPATRIAYKPLKIMPAPGELVAALYPLDDQWYRARVLSVTRADQNVEVIYIDYGNTVYVKENAIRELEVRFAALPAQAVCCALAGVTSRSQDSKKWAAAKEHLARIALNRTLDVHVIARGYDEITVEMFDESGYSVAERLADTGLVALTDYTVHDDSQATRKVVVP